MLSANDGTDLLSAGCVCTEIHHFTGLLACRSEMDRAHCSATTYRSDCTLDASTSAARAAEPSLTATRSYTVSNTSMRPAAETKTGVLYANHPESIDMRGALTLRRPTTSTSTRPNVERSRPQQARRLFSDDDIHGPTPTTARYDSFYNLYLAVNEGGGTSPSSPTSAIQWSDNVEALVRDTPFLRGRDISQLCNFVKETPVTRGSSSDSPRSSEHGLEFTTSTDPQFHQQRRWLDWQRSTSVLRRQYFSGERCSSLHTHTLATCRGTDNAACRANSCRQTQRRGVPPGTPENLGDVLQECRFLCVDDVVAAVAECGSQDMTKAYCRLEKPKAGASALECHHPHSPCQTHCPGSSQTGLSITASDACTLAGALADIALGREASGAGPLASLPTPEWAADETWFSFTVPVVTFLEGEPAFAYDPLEQKVCRPYTDCSGREVANRDDVSVQMRNKPSAATGRSAPVLLIQFDGHGDKDLTVMCCTSFTEEVYHVSHLEAWAAALDEGACLLPTTDTEVTT